MVEYAKRYIIQMPVKEHRCCVGCMLAELNTSGDPSKY